jgi:subtilisin family serine protease
LSSIDDGANVPSLALVALPRLMALTEGRRDIKIGLIDGRVMTTHPAFSDASIEIIHSENLPREDDPASVHATSVAGILVARRKSSAPAICPGASLVNRPLSFPGDFHFAGAATSDELASAIVDTTAAGARILNLSLALAPNDAGQGKVQAALDQAASRGLIVVAAAGNQGDIGSSLITRHPSVIPVMAYGLAGHPAPASNVGHSIGRRGVGAAGEGIYSLGADGDLVPFGGTSAATACVTGAIALLWSEFPRASSADIMFAVSRSTTRRVSVVPPLLDAWGAYELLQRMS